MTPDPAKLIPIHDDGAPIACTIADAEVPDRIDLVERLRLAATGVDRTPAGLLLHFPDDAAVRADLATFVVDEKRCCQFWGFEILEEHEGLALRWEGPSSVGEPLDRLHAVLTSDVPISSLHGLL